MNTAFRRINIEMKNKEKWSENYTNLGEERSKLICYIHEISRFQQIWKRSARFSTPNRFDSLIIPEMSTFFPLKIRKTSRLLRRRKYSHVSGSSLIRHSFHRLPKHEMTSCRAACMMGKRGEDRMVSPRPPHCWLKKFVFTETSSGSHIRKPRSEELLGVA